MDIKYFPLGDTAFIVRFGNEINVQTHNILKSCKKRIDEANIHGVISVIPSYTDLVVYYSPTEILYPHLLSELKNLCAGLEEISAFDKARMIKIPVCYGDGFGPDIEVVAKHNNITVDEVIRLHTSVKYLIYMLGFNPGFCYLGGLPDGIETPRKTVPAINIVAGSVGIAGKQTGIYPIDSPGGWQIIGKTPVKIFDIDRKPEVIFEYGDYIKFVPVSSEEFEEIYKNVGDGTYKAEYELINISDEQG